MSHFPLSEPVALHPGELLRIEQVSLAAGDERPRRFLHFHAPTEIVLFHAGSGQFHCDGWSTPFAPASAVFVPSLAAHDFAFAEGPLRWTLLQFDQMVTRNLPVAWPVGAACFALDADRQARVMSLLAWLREGLAVPLPRPALDLRLQALLAAIAEGAATLAMEAGAPAALGRLRPLLDRLHAAPDSAPRLAAAAASCAMSTAYFARQFRAAVGTSYAAYVELLRLQSASRWLLTGNDPIATIAERAGYRSHAHFSARFHQLFGRTPSEHRRGSVHTP